MGAPTRQALSPASSSMPQHFRAPGKYFELKVYQGLPHGFMVQNGQLWETDKAEDAYRQMVNFFKRMM